MNALNFESAVELCHTFITLSAKLKPSFFSSSFIAFVFSRLDYVEKRQIKYAENFHTADGSIKLMVDLKEGVYIMQVIFDEKIKTYKLLKQ